MNPKSHQDIPGRVSLEELDNRRSKGALLDRGRRLSPEQLMRELKRFGRVVKCDYRSFRSLEQEAVVYRALEGEDVLAIMPTGSGKSLAYQFTAFLKPKELTLVISPLKALIAQQDKFLPFGIGLTSDTFDRSAVWDSLLAGENYVLFISPEMLSNASFHIRLARYLKRGHLKLGRFVVDEVHCLSDWGHDFRAQYWWTAHYLRLLESQIPASTKTRDHVPLLLLTATADEQVLGDIRQHFPKIEDHEIVRAPANRPELVLSACRVDSARKRIDTLARLLRRQSKRPLPQGTPRRGIVFTLEAVSRDGGDDISNRFKADRLKADDVVTMLRKRGLRHVYSYSAKGMDKIGRDASREAFENALPRRGHVTAIIATNAFGMGMDYPSVPFVCHLYPRPNVSEYWQQVGRAGRGMNGNGDEGWAEALSLYSRKDARYSVRFAKAPAVDGLLNAFTIPLHGWMYVLAPGAGHMSLYGRGGGRTRFAKLLQRLQEMEIIGRSEHHVLVPKGAVRYRVNLRLLRRRSVLARLDELQDDEFPSKRLRKVFRYLRIASRSKKQQYIALDRWLYDHDRQGSVLQRLNRWVDAGYLELTSKMKKDFEIRLIATKRSLTSAMVRKIVERNDLWAEHKKECMQEMFWVLRASSPQVRQRRVLQYFGETTSMQFKYDRHVIAGLPKWLAKT
ncbi:MAG TPA: DEAD/DEAH box helicase [Clostridia bacterium]|nr:DEAD/DEAH box helicase [Clostridia bacterium]